MRILGVDPGSLATGWALVGGTASRPEMIEAGRIRLDAKQPFPERMARLYSACVELAARLRPSTSAVESPFHGASARSALQLAQARGVILAALAGAGLEVVEYTPASVKKSVTGNGRADKRQVMHMVGRLVGADTERMPHDATDALAVALCHLTGSTHRAALERGAAPAATGRRLRRRSTL